jgi:hypothetical protein
MIKLTSRRSPHPVRAPELAGDEIVAAADTLELVGVPAPPGRGVRAASLAMGFEQAEAAHREELSTSSRTARRRRWRLIAVGAAGAIMILASGGCAGVSSSSPASAYWLIRVSDGYGNIYGLGAGERAPQNAHAQYLGPTTADAHRYAPAAAKRLGITHVDPGIY